MPACQLKQNWKARNQLAVSCQFSLVGKELWNCLVILLTVLNWNKYRKKRPVRFHSFPWNLRLHSLWALVRKFKHSVAQAFQRQWLPCAPNISWMRTLPLWIISWTRAGDLAIRSSTMVIFLDVNCYCRQRYPFPFCFGSDLQLNPNTYYWSAPCQYGTIRPSPAEPLANLIAKTAWGSLVIFLEHRQHTGSASTLLPCCPCVHQKTAGRLHTWKTWNWQNIQLQTE